MSKGAAKILTGKHFYSSWAPSPAKNQTNIGFVLAPADRNNRSGGVTHHHKVSPCFIHGKKPHSFPKDFMHNYSKNARERINTAFIKDRENGGNANLCSINRQNEMSEEESC